MSRKLRLSLSPVGGSINRFYAFVDGKRVIEGDGTSRREWSGEVADEGVRIKTRVFGAGKAQYAFSIDLPGTAHDQTLTLELEGGYHEAEYNI
jgi:hypothetical protein